MSQETKNQKYISLAPPSCPHIITIKNWTEHLKINKCTEHLRINKCVKFDLFIKGFLKIFEKKKLKRGAIFKVFRERFCLRRFYLNRQQTSPQFNISVSKYLV